MFDSLICSLRFDQVGTIRRSSRDFESCDTHDTHQYAVLVRAVSIPCLVFVSPSRQMSVDTERLVLSEVHVGSSALDEEEVVSRYTYLTPPPRCNTSTTATAQDAAQAGSNANDSSSDSDDSSGSSEEESEKGGYSRVTRHRKRLRTSSQRRRPAHEVLTVVHRMATTLGLVGQQVWSAAFLLSDFVLTHEDIFAGMQVRCGCIVHTSSSRRLLLLLCGTGIHAAVSILLFRSGDGHICAVHICMPTPTILDAEYTYKDSRCSVLHESLQPDFVLFRC